ncbi:hypothetical protein GCM10022214_47680 [Actinomadura miaoliensis]|uniref:Uncharacterized protein n=1 Tax=Actinomadura miaoliensis TaxID=430685 RepID=A0ABP7W791_9ACTN
MTGHPAYREVGEDSATVRIHRRGPYDPAAFAVASHEDDARPYGAYAPAEGLPSHVRGVRLRA